MAQISSIRSFLSLGFGPPGLGISCSLLLFLFLGSREKEAQLPLVSAESPSFSQSLESIKGQMQRVEGGQFLLGGKIPCRVGDFEMGRYEVTQAQWVGIMGQNRSYFSSCASCPVERVSWNEAQGFIDRLNAHSAGGYRLPTEAEWEYAARGGRKGGAYRFAGGDELEELGWFLENAQGRTQKVGTLRPNALGLYDMSGNVWEWCSDWYQQSLDQGPLENPQGPLRGEDRVLRGGSWYVYEEYCALEYRFGFMPSYRNNSFGFRLARDW